MKKRQIRTLSFIGLFLCSAQVQAAASLPPEFKAVDSSMIKSLCGSSFEYVLGDKAFDLNRSLNENEYLQRRANIDVNIVRDGPGYKPVEIYEARDANLEELKEPYFQTEFHETINCYLNKSMKDLVEETNKITEEKHYEYENAKEFPIQIETPTECEADIPPPAFESTCPEDVPEYSPCKVAERIMAEHCAYSMWLWAKQFHEESLQVPEESTDTLNVTTMLDYRLQELQSERRKTEKAIRKSITAYEQMAKNYPTYTYMTSVRDHLGYFNEKLAHVRTAFELFPEKFINAMSKYCKQ